MIAPLPGDIFRAGQILNNTYEIEGVLGRGGTGEVYRARNLISGRIVAIKALNAQFSGQEGYIALMRREEQMRDIRDDAVVRYTECSRSDQGHVFLVMDYIDGPSIADVMLRRRMEARELMIVAHRVAEGLMAAHGHGIVHRDLSPDNVILRDGSPEKATIIDFGIAKDTGAGARTIVGNDFAGKYEYAAPEQMDGKAEPRSDLYALGALLLAAWKGQVPFAGMTPGEMIRRKSEPLDTAGVPEPLKGLIDWLSDPVLARRAPSAAAVVEQVGRVLKGPAGKAGAERERAETVARSVRGQAPAKKRSGAGLLVVLLLLLLGGAGGGAWYAGLLDDFMKPPLPQVTPFALVATAADGPSPARLTAHAPDEAGAMAIRTGFATLAGTEAQADAVTLAQGVPGPGWVPGAVAVFAAASGLEDWRISISDMTARVSGITPNAASARAIAGRLDDWAEANGFALIQDLRIGPKVLPVATVQSVLDGRETCGRLVQADPPADGYPLGATIAITGHAPDQALSADLQLALRDVVGDRALRIDLVTLNEDLCEVRRVLPDLSSNAVSIWMGKGETGEPNLTGIYGAGENPVVEVLVPESVTEGRLWVMVVDNTNMVFNLVPNASFPETEITSLGTVANGMRRVRVLFSLDEATLDKRLIAMKVNDGEFGKSEFLAFLTKDDLFSTRRPRDESVTSFAEALAIAQEANPGNILGFASRILESRP